MISISLYRCFQKLRKLKVGSNSTYQRKLFSSIVILLLVVSHIAVFMPKNFIRTNLEVVKSPLSTCYI